MDPLRWTIAEGWWLASALWRALDPDTSSKTASLLATEHATCRSEFARDSWSRQQAASYSRVGSSASCLLQSRGEFSKLPPTRSRLALQQVLHAVALFQQFLVRGIHLGAAERVNGEALHDAVFAVLAGDGVRVDDAGGDAIAAI